MKPKQGKDTKINRARAKVPDHHMADLPADHLRYSMLLPSSMAQQTLGTDTVHT